MTETQGQMVHLTLIPASPQALQPAYQGSSDWPPALEISLDRPEPNTMGSAAG
jgi:hypothetical protein